MEWAILMCFYFCSGIYRQEDWGATRARVDQSWYEKLTLPWPLFPLCEDIRLLVLVTDTLILPTTSYR